MSADTPVPPPGRVEVIEEIGDIGDPGEGGADLSDLADRERHLGLAVLDNVINRAGQPFDQLDAQYLKHFRVYEGLGEYATTATGARISGPNCP